MASEWARKKAEEILRTTDSTSPALAAVVRELQVAIAAALDAARQEGAERERWECAKIACVPGHAMATAIYAAITARGPIRGPEEKRR